MQMVHALDVDKVAAAVLGGALDVAGGEAGGRAELGGNDAGADWTVSEEQGTRTRMGHPQSTPRPSQAASTSGEPGRRNADSCMKDPLKRTLRYVMSTSRRRGAVR